MDVDQLPGCDRHRCEPDRDAETDDRTTGLYLAKGDLVAERYRLARDDRCSPGGPRRFVRVDIPQRDAYVVRFCQNDDVDCRRHDVLHFRLSTMGLEPS